MLGSGTVPWDEGSGLTHKGFAIAVIQFVMAGVELDHAALTAALQRSSDAVVRKPKSAAKNPGMKKPDVTKRKAESKRDSGSSSEGNGECSDGESSVSSVTESEDEAAAEVPEPTASGKRIRKAVQHFDPVKDGANDTKRRKESK